MSVCDSVRARVLYNFDQLARVWGGEFILNYNELIKELAVCLFLPTVVG